MLGNNGSGKTTLINLLVGFKKCDEGEIIIGGHSIGDNIHKIRDNLRLCQ
jgi:ABC-type multidrug transport system ATPase subunit